MSLIRSNFGKILLLWLFVRIKFTISKEVPDSPCPEIFSYAQRDGQWCGFITRPSSPYGTKMTLIVEFSVGAYLVSGYPGSIDIVGGKYEAINSVLNGLPIQYKTCFVNNIPLPKLTKILFNQETVCTGPPETLGVGNNGVTSFTLGHFYMTGNQQTMPGDDQKLMEMLQRPGPNQETNRPYPILQTEISQMVDPETVSIPQYNIPHSEYPQKPIRPSQTFMQHFLNPMPQNVAQSMEIPNRGTFDEPYFNDQPIPQHDPITYPYQPKPQHELITYPYQPKPQHDPTYPHHPKPQYDPTTYPYQPKPQHELFTYPYQPKPQPTTDYGIMSNPHQHIPQQMTNHGVMSYPHQPKPHPITNHGALTHQPTPQPEIQHDEVTQQQQPIIQTTEKTDSLTQPRHEMCGKKQSNLLFVNGDTYKKGDWPWLVAIYVQKTKSGLQFTCAGTLVSQRHIVTAAHCTRASSGRTLRASTVVVKVGAYDLQDWTDFDVKQLGVDKIFQHPQYDGQSNNFNDISLMVTSNNVTFTKYIVPACLWDMDDDLSKIVGRVGMVVGWGQDEHGNILSATPRGGPVPIVSTETCGASLADLKELVSNTTLCAGARDGSGPCNGDSGGGMYLHRNHRWYLRAIVSLSLAGDDLPCNLDEFTVYTDAAKYVPWMRSIMEKT